MGVGEVTINGSRTPLGELPTWTSTLDFLREHGLTGCKEGCAEGECGACAVLVARAGIATPTEWTAINACLVPIAALDGQEIVTSEGLGDADAMHPVQREIATRGGSQCGYCTPGFVCSMAAEYYRPGRGATPGEEKSGGHEPGDGKRVDASGGATLQHGRNGFELAALSGNLCRCTGYRPIRDAAYALGRPRPDDRLVKRLTQPPPPPAATRLSHDGCTFIRPATLTEALELLHEHAPMTVIAGCTDHGVEVNLKGKRAERVLAIERLEELRELSIGERSIEIGAALSLSEIERRLDGRVPLLAQLWPQFASRLIRNTATLGGNLDTSSPIGDSLPVLLALDARVVLASAAGERSLELTDFFTGYRTNARRPDELIRAVRIPLPLAPLQAFYKIAKRRLDDISSAAVAFAITLDREGVVERARIGLGGAAATPIRALATEAALLGHSWSRETVAHVAEILGSEGTPMSDHRASAQYRAAMLRSSLLKLQTQSPGSATDRLAA